MRRAWPQHALSMAEEPKLTTVTRFQEVPVSDFRNFTEVALPTPGPLKIDKNTILACQGYFHKKAAGVREWLYF